MTKQNDYNVEEKDCIFCKIINKEIDAISLYEDDLLQVIMDIDPINDGHLLIIPKAHKLDLDDLTQDESTNIMKLSKVLVKLLKQSFDLDGYSIMQNGGYFNDIGHYHMHIFPRYKGDGFAWHDSVLSKKDVAEVSSKLKANLKII